MKRSGKNKKSNYKLDDITFDSLEEIEFYLFLKDALRLKIISSFEYQPKSYLLAPKVTSVINIPYKRKKGYKRIVKTLLQPHSYTADFKFTPGPNFDKLGTNHQLQINKDNSILVDVKGAYNRFGGDRVFPINQKWLYAKYKLHVTKLIPLQFFKKIGAAPDELRWMKNRKVKTIRKSFQGLCSLDQLFDNNHEHRVINNIPYLSKYVNQKN